MRLYTTLLHYRTPSLLRACHGTPPRFLGTPVPYALLTIYLSPQRVPRCRATPMRLQHTCPYYYLLFTFSPTPTVAFIVHGHSSASGWSGIFVLISS